MNPALETLMLAFSGDDRLAVPQRALFLGAEPHPKLADWPEVVGWQPIKPRAVAWEQAGFTRSDEMPDGKLPLVLVLPGKSRDETLFWFAAARERLAEGGTIVAAMPNTAGAGRFEKELAKATGGVVSLQKNKCRAFHATDNGAWDEEIFAAWRALGAPREVSGFTVEAGIFSCDHVDPGSQFLAEHLPASLRGTVADLGAGWGFLSDAVLTRCSRVERVDLFEADARALDCARANLARHQPHVTRLESPVCYAEEEPVARFFWHDVTTGLPETYDAVVMNPPFHTGQATDVDLGRAFLRVATQSLKRGGKLFLVANRQLPYEPALTTAGLAWRKLAENATYKILFAEKRQ